LKLIIVSGLSGSGKTVALHTLEDLGYYCIDNLPASLLGSLASELSQLKHPVERVAVGIDARNLPHSLQQFSEVVGQLKRQGTQCEILYLTCETATLLKRFSESRRPHPLRDEQLSLTESIDKEQALLEPIARGADLFIDTSSTTVHQLRDQVLMRMDQRSENRLSLLFESFGYKHGIPNDADFVFDSRCLPNPHWQPVLRPLTGKDPEVAAFLEGQPQVEKMYEQIRDFLSTWVPAFERDNRSYLTTAIGCTGGQHRSVYLVERLTRHFRDRYPLVSARHREMS
jgi:UPF0042 nucleotide-binding protein